MAIVCTLLLFAAPLLAALPSRLRVWQGVVAVVLQALPLYVALGASRDSALGWLTFVGFAYVPGLVATRLVLQRRPVTPSGSMGESTP